MISQGSIDLELLFCGYDDLYVVSSLNCFFIENHQHAGDCERISIVYVLLAGIGMQNLSQAFASNLD